MMKLLGVFFLAGLSMGNILKQGVVVDVEPVVVKDIAVEPVLVEDEEGRGVPAAVPLHHVPAHVLENNTDLFDPEDLTPLRMMEMDRATTQCGCGYSNVNQAAGRIVNGQQVQNHARPYQAYLQIEYPQGSFLCGGTLVNKRYVITAMHCIVDDNKNLPTNLVVGLGLEGRTDNGANVQRLGVEKYIQRSDYEGHDNDIAILRLNADVQFNSDVQPACLPTDTSLTYAGKDAVVSGWGTTSSGGSTSSQLMEVTVGITAQSDSTCRAYGNLPNSQMCAYTAGKDSCQGDSGGPLVLQEAGRNTLVGVVSYGRGCASTGYAGVYARVTHFLDWINANIADGWCDGDTAPATSAPTTAAPATAAPATAAPATGPGAPCDLTCTNIGDLTGIYTLNGVTSSCNAGICSAQDGSDLCSTLGATGMCVAPTTTATTTTTTTTTTTAAPITAAGLLCDLRCAIGDLTGTYRLNYILSSCVHGYCLALDGRSLCATFNNPCSFSG